MCPPSPTPLAYDAAEYGTPNRGYLVGTVGDGPTQAYGATVAYDVGDADATAPFVPGTDATVSYEPPGDATVAYLPATDATVAYEPAGDATVAYQVGNDATLAYAPETETETPKPDAATLAYGIPDDTETDTATDVATQLFMPVPESPGERVLGCGSGVCVCAFCVGVPCIHAVSRGGLYL